LEFRVRMASNLPDMITLWRLESKVTDLEYFKKIDVGGSSMLEALRFTLEFENDILEWLFEFWDVKDK